MDKATHYRGELYVRDNDNSGRYVLVSDPIDHESICISAAPDHNCPEYPRRVQLATFFGPHARTHTHFVARNATRQPHHLRAEAQ